MAGLLDFLNTPAGQGLLAAGLGAAASSGHGRGLLGNLGTGGLMGLNAYTGAQDRAVQTDYRDLQKQNLLSEIEARKQQSNLLTRKQSILDGILLPNAPSQPALPGQLGSGSFGAVQPAAGVPAVPPPNPGAGIAARLTPETLLRAKLGAGVDLTDIYKILQPDMQVSNGFAYDKRTVRPGFLPQLNVAQNGQASMVQIGQDGLPVMTTPRGAVETYSSFRNADEAAKAGLDLVKVTGPDGAERYVTRAQAVQAAQPTLQPRAQTPQPQARMQSGDADRYAILSQELAKAQTAGNTGDVAAIEREISRLPAAARTGANPSGLAVPGPLQAGPSPAQTTRTEVDRQTALQQAKDLAEQRKSIMAADFAAPSNIAKYQQLGTLLQNVDGGSLTAAGTQLASAMNSVGLKVDRNLPNKEAAAALGNQIALELRNPAGGAGMPGAMSDKDRDFLVSMIPNAGQTVEGRKMIIDSYIALQKRNQQVASFARRYEKKYGKLDSGFYDQMQAWSNENPLFKGQ